MSKYDVCKTLESLANIYGNDMRLHGMSQYWSSPKTYEDTTDELVHSKIYESLSMYEKSQIITYGQQMKQYGMGCYATNGACARLYDKYVGKGGVPNPFVNNEFNNENDGPEPQM